MIFCYCWVCLGRTVNLKATCWENDSCLGCGWDCCTSDKCLKFVPSICPRGKPSPQPPKTKTTLETVWKAFFAKETSNMSHEKNPPHNNDSHYALVCCNPHITGVPFFTASHLLLVFPPSNAPFGARTQSSQRLRPRQRAAPSCWCKALSRNISLDFHDDCADDWRQESHDSLKLGDFGGWFVGCWLFLVF